MGDDDAEFGLVVPFVVCQSKGGPYEDRSFVAGYQAGLTDRSLAIGAATNVEEIQVTVYDELVPQLELVAMHHNYPLMKTHGVAPGWALVSFRRTYPPREEA